MKKNSKTSASKNGMPPGSLVHIGQQQKSISSINIIKYNLAGYERLDNISVENLIKYKSKDCVLWVNVSGHPKIEFIEALGKYFNIHPLVLEDILNTQQRVKVEDYNEYLFFVFKQIFQVDKSINYGQLSIILFDNFIFTFSESPENTFSPIERRLEPSNSRIRSQKSDYLLYAIIDFVVDQYFLLIDNFEEALEAIDESLISNPEKFNLSEIHKNRKKVIEAKRSIYPIRDIIMFLIKNDLKHISSQNEIYFRDIYDHTLRITNYLDEFREIVSNQLDIYLSSISNKMNSIMKFLTIFAAIFIPLTFLAGIYGMNFEYMPELKWKYSYPIIWCIFIIIAIALIVFFKKKKWF